MKKSLLTCLISSIIFICYAQTPVGGPIEKQFYLKAQLGYSVGFGSRVGINYANNGGGYEYKNIYGSYGNGVGGGVGLGYFFNNYLGVELNASVNALNVPEFNLFPDRPIYIYSKNPIKINSTGFQISINPTIIIKAPIGKLTPYLKLGAVVPIYTYFKRKYEIPIKNNGINQITIENNVSTSISLGITGCIGTYIYLSKNFSLFGEITYISLSQNTAKSIMTSFKVDDTEQVGSMTINQKEIDYSDSYTDPPLTYTLGGTTISYDYRNQPQKALSETISMTNIGLQLGVVYKFGE